MQTMEFNKISEFKRENGGGSMMLATRAATDRFHMLWPTPHNTKLCQNRSTSILFATRLLVPSSDSLKNLLFTLQSLISYSLAHHFGRPRPEYAFLTLAPVDISGFSGLSPLFSVDTNQQVTLIRF